MSAIRTIPSLRPRDLAATARKLAPLMPEVAPGAQIMAGKFMRRLAGRALARIADNVMPEVSCLVCDCRCWTTIHVIIYSSILEMSDPPMTHLRATSYILCCCYDILLPEEHKSHRRTTIPPAVLSREPPPQRPEICWPTKAQF